MSREEDSVFVDAVDWESDLWKCQTKLKQTEDELFETKRKLRKERDRVDQLEVQVRKLKRTADAFERKEYQRCWRHKKMVMEKERKERVRKEIRERVRIEEEERQKVRDEMEKWKTEFTSTDGALVTRDRSSIVVKRK